MLIELVGIPASGKSTLAHEIRQHLEHQSVPLAEAVPEASLSRTLRVLLTRPGLLLVALAGLATSHSSMWERWFFVRRFVRALVVADAASRCATAVTVVDEGLAQRSMSIFVARESRLHRYLVRAYARRCPAPTVLIRLIDVPVNVAVGRARARRQPLAPRFRSLDDAGLHVAFTQAQATLNDFCEQHALSAPLLEMFEHERVPATLSRLDAILHARQTI